MDRNILLLLEKWSSSAARRSLILRGARQVGKTWAVRELARRLGLTLVEVNFERQGAVRGDALRLHNITVQAVR
jgi:hypothetical protein